MLGIYCRTSKLREVKYTIENQKEGGVKCAQTLGLKYRIYTDDGISGVLDDSVRDGLADLFKDIRSGDISHIYVIDQSRIERETNTWRFFVSLCLNHNVRYFPSGIEYNLDDPTNRMLANVMSIFNAYYAEITSKKVRAANAKKAQLGLTHGLLPYGYSKDQNNKYKVLENEAKYVRLMFKLSLEGKGAYTIANILNEKGIPTKFSGNFTGKIKRKDAYTKEVRYFDKEKVKWRGNVISDILKNPIYKGERNWHRHEDHTEFIDGKLVKSKVVAEVITADAPKIIDNDLFDKVQANFKNNRKNVGRRDEYNYLLNGLIYCEKCGRQFRGKKRLKGNDNAYKCSGKIYPNSSCNSRGIGIPKLDTFIIRYLFLNKDFRKRVDELNKSEVKENKYLTEINKCNKELAGIKKSLKHLYGILIDPDFSGIEDLKSQLKSLQNKERSIINKLEVLNEKHVNSDKTIIKNRIKSEIKSMSSDLEKGKLDLDFEQLKKVVHSIVDWISIDHLKMDKGGRFTIKLKIKDIDEYHYFVTDWSLNNWNFLDIVERATTQSIDEIIIQSGKQNFDIRNELENYKNLTKFEYEIKHGKEKQEKRTDLRSRIILVNNEIYHFD
jgi:site-specific DNA recombinase